MNIAAQVTKLEARAREADQLEAVLAKVREALGPVQMTLVPPAQTPPRAPHSQGLWLMVLHALEVPSADAGAVVAEAFAKPDEADDRMHKFVRGWHGVVLAVAERAKAAEEEAATLRVKVEILEASVEQLSETAVSAERRVGEALTWSQERADIGVAVGEAMNTLADAGRIEEREGEEPSLLRDVGEMALAISGLLEDLECAQAAPPSPSPSPAAKDLRHLDEMIADERAQVWDLSAKDRAVLKRLRALFGPPGEVSTAPPGLKALERAMDSTEEAGTAGTPIPPDPAAPAPPSPSASPDIDVNPDVDAAQRIAEAQAHPPSSSPGGASAPSKDATPAASAPTASSSSAPGASPSGGAATDALDARATGSRFVKLASPVLQDRGFRVVSEGAGVIEVARGDAPARTFRVHKDAVIEVRAAADGVVHELAREDVPEGRSRIDALLRLLAATPPEDCRCCSRPARTLDPVPDDGFVIRYESRDSRDVIALSVGYVLKDVDVGINFGTWANTDAVWVFETEDAARAQLERGSYMEGAIIIRRVDAHRLDLAYEERQAELQRTAPKDKNGRRKRKKKGGEAVGEAAS